MAKNKANKTDKTKKQIKNKRHFWKDFKAELKKVVWPTPRQLINSTVAVITIVLVTALIVFVLDGFEAIKTHGIDKLQASLQSNNSNTVENTTSESTDEASSEATVTDGENTTEENSEETANTTEDAQ